jgi:putative peptide maturation dehydrogenase
LSRVRRARYVAFACSDELAIDVGRLLRGKIELVPVAQPVALSVLTGKPQALSRQELELALEVPEAWTARDELLAGREATDADRLDQLARKGVVVTDDDGETELVELRRREETLTADSWSAHSALYHFMAKWRDVCVDLNFDTEQLGMPPPHFVSLPDPPAVTPLPRGSRRGQLYNALLRRKTSRAFDRDGQMTADQLATILANVWGCHGLAELGEGVAMLKKTSPSGGGLHPIEVYPLVRDVEGVESGLYHYGVRDHVLELISTLTGEDVEQLVGEFTAGQTYFQEAAVLFVMAGRFDRTFWKYRDHVRAYAVLLMDAGHLSQTFYLVCTELGLGAFVTAAINGANIEERLGLDGYKQGALVICGCGRPGDATPDLEPVFKPYPR